MGKEEAQEGLSRLAILELIGSAMDPDPGTSFGRVAALEASLYMRNQLLRDTDWASMAHSLEVRVPLVDAALLPAIATQAAAGHIKDKSQLIASPGTPLPSGVVHRAKTGFSIPVAQWLQEHRDVDQWRKIPALAAPNTPWARRWAHVIATRFASS